MLASPRQVPSPLQPPDGNDTHITPRRHMSTQQPHRAAGRQRTSGSPRVTQHHPTHTYAHTGQSPAHWSESAWARGARRSGTCGCCARRRSHHVPPHATMHVPLLPDGTQREPKRPASAHSWHSPPQSESPWHGRPQMLREQHSRVTQIVTRRHNGDKGGTTWLPIRHPTPRTSRPCGSCHHNRRTCTPPCCSRHRWSMLAHSRQRTADVRPCDTNAAQRRAQHVSPNTNQPRTRARNQRQAIQACNTLPARWDCT